MKLHYRSYGEGPPVVLLHGLFGSLDNWHSISRELARRFRVYAPDQRNHGDSPHSAEMNYPAMAEDVLDFIRSIGLERAAVVGHSMGGKTAMELALAHPEAVDRLVVVDISPRAYAPCHERIFNGLLALEPAGFENRGEIEAALAPAIPSKSVRQFLLKSLARDPGGAFRWKLNLRDLFANYGRLSEALAGNRVFRGPALFLRGGKSEYLPESDWGLVRSLFPGARLETVAGAGHWVHAEAPEPFLKNVLEFLDEPAAPCYSQALR